MFEVGNVKIKNKVIFAPMAGVSNISFRTIIKEMGAGLIYSEMISTMGIKYGSQKTIDLINFRRSSKIYRGQLSSWYNRYKYGMPSTQNSIKVSSRKCTTKKPR